MENEKPVVCKRCGRDVLYYRIDKGIGKKGKEKHTHLAIHVGDIVPMGAVEISKLAISSTYRNRLREKFNCGPADSNPDMKTESGDTDPDSTSFEVLETIQSTRLEVVPKEKVVIEPKIETPVERTFTEIHEIPEISADKPIIDLTEVKKNKFAALGAIRVHLNNLQKTEDAKRFQEAATAGHNSFEGIVMAAAPFVQVWENGHPLAFQ